jgi:hypothetical protein
LSSTTFLMFGIALIMLNCAWSSTAVCPRSYVANKTTWRHSHGGTQPQVVGWQP